MQVRPQPQRHACCWHCWRGLPAPAQRIARLPPPAARQHLQQATLLVLRSLLGPQAGMLAQSGSPQAPVLNTLQSMRRQLRQQQQLGVLLWQTQTHARLLAGEQRRQARPGRQTAELPPVLQVQLLAHPPPSMGPAWTRARRQQRRRQRMRPRQGRRPLQARRRAGRMLHPEAPWVPVLSLAHRQGLGLRMVRTLQSGSRATAGHWR